MLCSYLSLHILPVAIKWHSSALQSQFCIGMGRAWKFVLAVTAFSQFSSVHAILGGRFAAIPPYNDPVVFVNHVGRFSRIEGYQNPSTGFYTFRGIRYADPPVRENRFLRPRLKRLDGDINAKLNAPPCPQPDYYGEFVFSSILSAF